MANDQLHICRETMVFGVSSNSESPHTKMILSWPTCSKSEKMIQGNLIQTISNKFKEENGWPSLCCATDGDPNHRQLFNSLMNNDIMKSLTLN